MSVEKAKKMDAEAEALATTKFPPWGLKEKKEEAIELWKKSAQIYKVSKEWRAAAKAYKRAAETALLIKAELEATNNWNEAAKALKNLDDGENEAIELFEKSAKSHVANNRMVMGGKIFRQIAEMEEKLGRTVKAMQNYELAAEIFYTSDMSGDGHQCIVKVAEYKAHAGEYKEAIQAYEKVIDGSLDNRIQQYAVKGYMYHALLCVFAQAAKNASSAKSTLPAQDEVKAVLNRYENQYPALVGTRESKFINKLIKAYEEASYENCTKEIATEHRIYKLTPLQLALCEVIKRACPGQVLVAGTSGVISTSTGAPITIGKSVGTPTASGGAGGVTGSGSGGGGSGSGAGAQPDGPSDDFLQNDPSNAVNMQADPNTPIRAKPTPVDQKTAPATAASGAASSASGAKPTGGAAAAASGSAGASASAAYASAALSSSSPAPTGGNEPNMM